MNILFVSEHFHPRPGGGELWAYRTCKELATRGHSITVITSTYPGSPAQEHMDGFQVVRIGPSGGIFRRIIFLKNLKTYLLRYLREHQVDIIHSTAYIASAAAAGVATRLGIPSVVSVHLYQGRDWIRFSFPPNILNFLLERILLSRLGRSTITVPSQFTKDLLEPITHRNPVHVLANFLEIDDIQQICESTDPIAVKKAYGLPLWRKLIVYAGSLYPLKQVHVAARILKETSDDFTFLIIGEGDTRAEIESIAKDDSRFKLLPPKPWGETIRLLSCADLILNPSINETFSYLVAEGLVLNKQVICRDTGVAYDFKSKNLAIIQNLRELPEAVEGAKPDQVTEPHILEAFSKDRIIENLEEIYRSVRRS